MEKRNYYSEERTPCRALRGEKFCDCPSCSKMKKASVAQKSITDVDSLSEKHNELKSQ